MSAKPDDLQRLVHINVAIERIFRFTQPITREEFLDNEMAQFAVIKNFEIIGEAAYHLSDDFKKTQAHIEWRKIAAFRHILVHQYYEVDMGIVWNTIEKKLGKLGKDVKDLLEDY